MATTVMRRGPIAWWIRLGLIVLGFGAGFWIVSRLKGGGTEALGTFTNVDRLANPLATLTLAGTSIPVSIRATNSEGQVTFTLLSENKAIDREVYRVNPSGVMLSEITGDSFSPDIPLLLFPINLGGEESWKGTLASNGVNQPAEAKIMNVREDLNVAGGPFDSVKVQVSLRVNPDSGTLRERELVFWIVDQQGIVKRDISGISTREPR